MSPVPDPQDVEELSRLMTAGDYPGARVAAERITATEPRHVDALRALAEISLKQGVLEDSQRFTDLAIAEKPDDIGLMLLGSRVAQACGDSARAIAWCDRGLSLKPGDQACLLAKAATLERSGDWRQAEVILAPMMSSPSSSDAPPGAAQLWAQVLLAKGDAEAAARTIDSGLAQFTSSAPAPRPVRARMLFIKAKALDRLKNYDGAFRAALQAKAISAVAFDPKAYVARIDAIVRVFSRERLASLPKATPTGTRHVFIAGMPRSGTTLIEQILDAHPDAAGVGEATEIEVLASRLQTMVAATSAYPECVASLSEVNVNAFRAEYEAAQVRHGFGPAEVFVNKHLENHLHLGLIALLFPDAKVIVPKRDPRDVAVSCVMSNFRPDKHPGLSTLEHIALAYRQWERLMVHWRGVLDLDFLDVAYEDLVRDQDAWTGRMLQFVGLAWDDRCSRFWQSGRTVTTLSYAR